MIENNRYTIDIEYLEEKIMAFCELTMRSTVMMMDVKVSVIIPESRKDYHSDDPSKKHPCLYILHGSQEDNSTWLNSSILYLLARDLDLFIVMPSAYNTCYVNTTFGLNMQKYIAEELPVKMERLFPISNKREDRFIMGESMGGYGTWLTSLSYPDRYSKAIPLSQGGFRDFKHILDTGAHSIDTLAKEVNDTAKEIPEYYLMCGTEDMLFKDVKRWEEFLKENCPNIPVTYEYWSGKHDFYFWNQAIPKALQFLGFEFDPEKIKQI